MALSRNLVKNLKPKIVLCDIEGTTTSISFVKDVLFPFSKRHSKDYLTLNWATDQVKSIVKDLTQLPQFNAFKAENAGIGDQISIQSIDSFVCYLVDKDLKVAPLKTLQGLVWEQGYCDKTIKGHLYNDVPDAFEKWTRSGIKIYIYSSGSVAAQKLLFENSEYGDMLPYISGHFDTTVGYKHEAKSYENILSGLAVHRADVVFLTDVIKEATAATEAGIATIILDRPGNAPLTEDEKDAFVIVKTFDELFH